MKAHDVMLVIGSLRGSLVAAARHVEPWIATRGLTCAFVVPDTMVPPVREKTLSLLFQNIVMSQG